MDLGRLAEVLVSLVVRHFCRLLVGWFGIEGWSDLSAGFAIEFPSRLERGTFRLSDEGKGKKKRKKEKFYEDGGALLALIFAMGSGTFSCGRLIR